MFKKQGRLQCVISDFENSELNHVSCMNSNNMTNTPHLAPLNKSWEQNKDIFAMTCLEV